MMIEAGCPAPADEATEPRQRISAMGYVSAKATSADVGEHLRGSQTRVSELGELYQQGSARIRFPNSEPGAVHAVLLNTAGGLTGNDSIHWKAGAEKHAHLCVSTAACEKIYRTHGPAAVQQTTLNTASHARLEWLPQESILFNGSHLKRQMEVHLEEQADALIVESLVLGRQAMKESVDRIRVRDRWRIFRNKRLLHAEDLYLDTHANTRARTQCMLHQYSAISTLILLTDQPDEWYQVLLSQVRSLATRYTVDSADIRVGASVLPSRLVVRTLAKDSFQLRKFLIPCIELLNGGRAVPAVWKV